MPRRWSISAGPIRVAGSTTCRTRSTSICASTRRRCVDGCSGIRRRADEPGRQRHAANAFSARWCPATTSTCWAPAPALGRFFRPDEDQVPGERPVVVLSHAFWQRRFNSDPDILRKPLRLNNRDFSVVGVAEPGLPGLVAHRHRRMGADGDGAGGPRAAQSDMLTDARGVLAHGDRTAEARRRDGAGQAELNTLDGGVQESRAARQPAAQASPCSAWAGSGAGAHAVPGVHRLPVRADGRAGRDRVQQRRRHAAGARGDAAARNGDAPRGRRRPRAADSRSC